MVRLRRHIECCRYTTSNAGASPPRILRRAKAIYNWGQIARGTGLLLGAPTTSGGHLGRASVEIPGWGGGREGGSGDLQGAEVTRIGQRVRVSLGQAGPRFMVPPQAEQYRRGGYIYYDGAFAELAYCIAARPDVRGRPRAIWGALLGRYIRSGCESSLLTHSRKSFHQRALGDVLHSVAVQNMRRRFPIYRTKKGEFEAICHYGAYRVLTPMNNHLDHGANVRKSKRNERRGRQHVAHTLTTGRAQQLVGLMSYAKAGN